MSKVDLNIEAFRSFKSKTGDGPIVMLNLLKFKPQGGAESYSIYAAPVEKMVRERGGRVLYAGRAADMLVGSETWDAVLLVEYPSREAFIDMISSPDYQAAHAHREAALERAVLYATERTDLKNV